MPVQSRFHINRELLVYKAFYFFFLSGFGSIFPYLPVYFRQMGLPASQVGLLIGVRPIVQFASAPFWAIVADKYRKRKAVLVMSVLAWLIMTLSLAFVEPTNEICEVRAGNGSDMRVVNYTKVKTGFFRRSLLAVQEDVNTGNNVEKSPDLVVVAVSAPRPELSTKGLASAEEIVQSGSGQDPQSIFLTGSTDHDFVHDEVRSPHSNRTGRHPLKVKHLHQIGLAKDRSLNEITEGFTSNSTSRKSRKATWFLFHKKNNYRVSQSDKPASSQIKRVDYSKTATRIGQLLHKQPNNTHDSSTLNETKTTGTRKQFVSPSPGSLDQQVVKNNLQLVSGGESVPRQNTPSNSSEEADKRQLIPDKKYNSTNVRHKSKEKRKNTRNEKSSGSPPVVIEFSRILIPQEEGNDPKSSLHHPSEKRNRSTHAQSDNKRANDSGAFSSESVEEPTEKDTTTTLVTSEDFGQLSVSERKDKPKGELQSVLQLRQSVLEKNALPIITNESSSYEQIHINDAGSDESSSGVHPDNQQGHEFGSGHKEASDFALQEIGRYSANHGHIPDEVGKQSVYEDSLHQEELDNTDTKVIHNTKGLVLGSRIGKLGWANGTKISGTILGEPHLDSNSLRQKIADITPDLRNTTIGIDQDKISGKSRSSSLMGDRKAQVQNKTDPTLLTTVVVSSKSKMKIQITKTAFKNDSEEPATIHMVAEHVSDEDESKDSLITNALLSTKNLLKENVSELKRIFTIMLVLIVVGEFLEAPSFTLADASLLEILGEERRFYGKQRLWGSLGFGIFSFLVGVLLERSSHVVCGEQYTDYMICFCVFAIFIVLTLFVSTTFNFQYNERKVEHASVMYSLCNIHYGSCLVAACFMGVGHGMSHNFVNWFLEDLGGSKTLMGIAVICRCAADLLTFFIAGSLIKYVGQIRLMVVSLISYGVAFTSYSLLSNPWWVLPVEALNGMTYAASWSACTSYMAGAVSPEAVTTVQGILQGVYWGLGTGSGTIVGGYLIHHVGPVLTFRLTSCSCFVVCVLFCIAQFKWTKDSTDLPQTQYTYLPTVKTKDTEALLSGYGTNTKRPKAKMKHRSSKY